MKRTITTALATVAAIAGVLVLTEGLITERGGDRYAGTLYVERACDPSSWLAAGDSLLVGAHTIGGWDAVSVDAEVGRSVDEAVTVIEAALEQPKAPAAVVLAAGTNGWGADPGTIIERLDTIRQSAHLVVVVPRIPADPAPARITTNVIDFRDTVRTWADQHPDVTVVNAMDWIADPDWITRDGVHYTNDGYIRFAAWLNSAVCAA